MKQTQIEKVLKATESALKHDRRTGDAWVYPKIHVPSVRIDVYSRSVNRALLVLRLFLNAVDVLGGAPEFQKDRCVINYRRHSFPFRIRELSKREKRADGWGHDRKATGLLELSIETNHYSPPRWADSSTIKLEDKIPKIVQKIPEFALAAAKEKLERARQHRQYEREERAQELEEERLEKAFENTRDLLSAMSRFHKAERINRFLDAIERDVKECGDNLAKSWVAGAREYAASLAVKPNGKPPWMSFHDIIEEAGGLFAGQGEGIYPNGHTEIIPKIIPFEPPRKNTKPSSDR